MVVELGNMKNTVSSAAVAGAAPSPPATIAASAAPLKVLCIEWIISVSSPQNRPGLLHLPGTFGRAPSIPDWDIRAGNRQHPPAVMQGYAFADGGSPRDLSILELISHRPRPPGPAARS